MEEALGIALLLRGPKGVEPTEEGELLAMRARTLLADMAQTEDEIRSFGKEPAGTVRLGLPGTISHILSVPLITRCRDLYPGIKIIVAEAMSGFVREWLMARSVELAVIYVDLHEPGVAAEALLEEELVLLAPASSAANAALVTLDFLKGKPLILPSEAHGLRIMLEKVFDANGLQVEPSIELDSYSNIKRLVEAGYGYSILPRHAVVEEETAGRLVIRRFTTPALTRRAFMIRDVSRPTTRATAIVASTLKETVADLISTDLWPGARAVT